MVITAIIKLTNLKGFLGNFGKIFSLQPPQGRNPHLREILDPPLHCEGGWISSPDMVSMDQLQGQMPR